MPTDGYAELIAFLGRKFDAIDERFAALDHRFTAVDRRFAAIDQRFDVVDQRFDVVDQRFSEVLGRLEHIYGRLERLEQEYQAILEGVRRIERLIGDERVKREELERGLELLKRQLAALQGRVEALEQQLRR
jgi:chromosome segregation ATPase